MEELVLAKPLQGVSKPTVVIINYLKQLPAVEKYLIINIYFKFLRIMDIHSGSPNEFWKLKILIAKLSTTTHCIQSKYSILLNFLPVIVHIFTYILIFLFLQFKFPASILRLIVFRILHFIPPLFPKTNIREMFFFFKSALKMLSPPYIIFWIRNHFSQSTSFKLSHIFPRTFC